MLNNIKNTIQIKKWAKALTKRFLKKTYKLPTCTISLQYHLLEKCPPN